MAETVATPYAVPPAGDQDDAGVAEPPGPGDAAEHPIEEVLPPPVDDVLLDALGEERDDRSESLLYLRDDLREPVDQSN